MRSIRGMFRVAFIFLRTSRKELAIKTFRLVLQTLQWVMLGVLAASLLFALALVGYVDGWSLFWDFLSMIFLMTLAFVSVPALLAGMGLLAWLRRDIRTGILPRTAFWRGALVGWLAALATSIAVTLYFQMFFPGVLIYAFGAMLLGAIAGGLAAIKIRDTVIRAEEAESTP